MILLPVISARILYRYFCEREGCFLSTENAEDSRYALKSSRPFQLSVAALDKGVMDINIRLLTFLFLNAALSGVFPSESAGGRYNGQFFPYGQCGKEKPLYCREDGNRLQRHIL